MPVPVPVPSDFDNQATDPTVVNVASMLPRQFNDNGDVFYRTSGEVHRCPSGYETTDLGNMLRNEGCRSEVAGTYLDSSEQIEVMVWVIPMPNVTNAEAVFDNRVQGGNPNDWGIWCPVTGVGSQICQEPWHSATSYGRIGYCRRYLMHSRALYVDLRSDSAALPDLTLAATAANLSIGAYRIPAAQC